MCSAGPPLASMPSAGKFGCKWAFLRIHQELIPERLTLGAFFCYRLLVLTGWRNARWCAHESHTTRQSLPLEQRKTAKLSTFAEQMSQSLVVSTSPVNCQLSLESYIFYIGAKSSIESKKPIHLLMAYTN
jgi:hypothetical protein